MKILSLSLLFIVGIALAQVHTHKDVIQKYKDTVKSDVDAADIHDLLSVYYKIQSLKDQGVQPNQIISGDQICKFLARINISPLVHTHLIDEFISLRHDFQCSSIEVAKKFEHFFSKVSRGANFNDLEAAILIAAKDKSLIETKSFQDLCTKLSDFLLSDGSVKQSKKGDGSSLKDTASFLNLVGVCKQAGYSVSKAESEIKSALENIKSAKYIGDDLLAFPDGDVFVTTASLVSALLSYNPSLIPATKLGHFANYIYNHKDQLTTPEKTVAFFNVVGSLKNVPIPIFRTKNFALGKGMTAKVDFTNVVDEAFTGKITKVKGSLNSASKQLEEFEFTKDGSSYTAKFDGAKASTGYHTLNIDVTVGNATYSYSTAVLLQKENVIDSIRFDILKTKEKQYTPLNHEVRSGKNYEGKLTANQNSYIHISFSVKSDAPKANFVAARLVNPKHPHATGTVAAVHHKESNEYYIVIDLGDPDHILPYNDQYDLELVVASEHIHHNLDWRFAKVDVTFVKPAAKAPKTDAEFDALPEIQHMFPADRKKPNPIITLAFSGAVGVLCVFFLSMLTKIRGNQDAAGRFPTSFFGSIYSLVFMAGLLGLLGVLVLFWTKINLFQTLSILAVGAIPLVFVGNKALASIEKS